MVPTDFAALEQTSTQSKVAQFLVASDTRKLAYYHYPAPAGAPIVVLYHGSGAYQLYAYHAIAQELQRHNIGSYLIDFRGHGRSQGERGDTPSIKRLWDDFDEMIGFITAKNPTSPLYGVGHSSGCGFMLNYLKNNSLPAVIKKLIFIAPFLSSNSKTIIGSFVKKVSVVAFAGYMLSNGWLCAHRTALQFKYPERLLKRDSLLVNTATTVMAMATSLWDADIFLKTVTTPIVIATGDGDEYIGASRFEQMKKAGELSPAVEVKTVAGKDHFSVLAAAVGVIEEAINH